MTQAKSLIGHLIFDEAVFTAMFCAFVAFFTIIIGFSSMGDIPVWGSVSLSSQVLVSGFLVGCGSYWAVRRHVKAKFGQSWGYLKDTRRVMRFAQWFAGLSKPVKMCSVGVLAMGLVSMPLLMVLGLTDLYELTLWQFAGATSAVAALQGLVIAPIAALIILSEKMVKSNIRSLRHS